MLYQKARQIEQYLSHYKILGIASAKDTLNVRFDLKNLHTDKVYKLECENPMYNVLSSPITSLYDFSYDALKVHTQNLRRITFSDVETEGLFANKYLNTEYYNRYKTIKHTEEKYSTEHLVYFELSDLEKLKNLTGIIENEITDVYGHFFKLDDNTLRLIVNPKAPVLEDVDEVLFCDFFLFSQFGNAFPIYHLIYTKQGSNDVYLELTNLFVNSINNRGSVTVNLTDIFAGVLDTLYDDMKSLNGYNTDLFIVNNLFTCAIFLNTPQGIVRYVPINFDKSFFKVAFYKFKITSDKNATTEEVESDGANIRNFDNFGAGSTGNDLRRIINEKRMIPLTDMENIDLLNQLLHLTSTAEYYNDVLFSLNDSEFQFPVYLVQTLNEIETDYQYSGWDVPDDPNA